MADIRYMRAETAQTVSVLKDLLARAAAGQIDCVIAMAVDVEGNMFVLRGGTLARGTDALAMVGLLEREKRHLDEHVESEEVPVNGKDDG